MKDTCEEPCCDDALLTIHAENRRVWDDNNRLRERALKAERRVAELEARETELTGALAFQQERVAELEAERIGLREKAALWDEWDNRLDDAAFYMGFRAGLAGEADDQQPFAAARNNARWFQGYAHGKADKEKGRELRDRVAELEATLKDSITMDAHEACCDEQARQARQPLLARVAELEAREQQCADYCLCDCHPSYCAAPVARKEPDRQAVSLRSRKACTCLACTRAALEGE